MERYMIRIASFVYVVSRDMVLSFVRDRILRSSDGKAALANDILNDIQMGEWGHVLRDDSQVQFTCLGPANQYLKAVSDETDFYVTWV